MQKFLPAATACLLVFVTPAFSQYGSEAGWLAPLMDSEYKRLQQKESMAIIFCFLGEPSKSHIEDMAGNPATCQVVGHATPDACKQYLVEHPPHKDDKGMITWHLCRLRSQEK